MIGFNDFEIMDDDLNLIESKPETMTYNNEDCGLHIQEHMYDMGSSLSYCSVNRFLQAKAVIFLMRRAAARKPHMVTWGPVCPA